MLNKNGIKKLILLMREDVDFNLEVIKSAFDNLDYSDEEGQSILHILVDGKYDEYKCFWAIKTLLQKGLSPNLEDAYKYNFIQTALYAGYSEDFILKIITEALKYGLNVNHVDDDKDTIMHTAIYSDDYLGNVESIYDLLHANGFDSSLRDYEERNLIDAMIFQKQYSEEQITRFKIKFEERNPKSYQKTNIEEVKQTSSGVKTDIKYVKRTLSDRDIAELEKYGKILNRKNYVVAPTIGREKELKNLMITLAQDKKHPIIVGESGVGKTAIVDELAYRIKNGQVPNFLQGQTILEINPSDVVAGCRYVGMFEDNMTKLMDLCEKLGVIVFIDEIHTIYGIGSADGKNNDMASMLKHYIDRSDIKVIGTTTEKEYSEFFGNDALKRRFEKISVKEPVEDILYQIIDKVISDYYVKTGIYFQNENIKNEVINIILDATKKNHRVYNDVVNNPDLSISIVDKAFAFAKVYDSEFITEEHFIESFEYCDRIYDSIKEKSIEKLRSLDKIESKSLKRILKIDFTKNKK